MKAKHAEGRGRQREGELGGDVACRNDKTSYLYTFLVWHIAPPSPQDDYPDRTHPIPDPVSKGFVSQTDGQLMSIPTDALPEGTRLEELEIRGELGSGGFGITYLALDLTLERHVAVKEYLPRDWGMRGEDGTVVPRSSSAVRDYSWGLRRFIGEARALARLDHPNVVRVHRVMKTKGTAYLVMDYLDGESLAEKLAAGGPMRESEVRPMLTALAEGLAPVHEAGMLHRDIKPANVMLRSDGTPVLIDFGAARQQMGEHSKSLTAVLTPGYAPVEQYSNAIPQGPWTDIYALGAVAYAALTGQAPNDAVERMTDDRLPPVEEAAPGTLSRTLTQAVGAALTVNARLRPQDLAAWRAMLDQRADAGAPAQEHRRPVLELGGENGALNLRADSRGSGESAGGVEGRGRLSPGADGASRRVLEHVRGLGWTVLGAGAAMLAAVTLVTVALVARPDAPSGASAPVSSADGGGADSAILSDSPDPKPAAGPAGAGALAQPGPDPPALDHDGQTPPEGSAATGARPERSVANELSVVPASVALASPGATRLMSATVLDRNDQEILSAPVSWRTTDAGVANVDQQGLVTAVGPGNATLTATSGLASATARIVVTRPEPRSIAVVPASLELASGTRRRLTPTVLDENGREVAAPVAWETENVAVATIDSEGMVTATGPGSTTLTARAGTAVATVAAVVPMVAGHRFRDCADCPEMIVVDAATFPMGSPSTEAGRQANEGPRRFVTMEAPFAVGVHEVTFDQWIDCARGGGCDGRIPDDEGWGAGARPVINVSWSDARSYAEWLSSHTGKQYRLPSEAEWEYVARANTETPRYWDDDQQDQCRHANGYDAVGFEEHGFNWAYARCSDGSAGPAPVGSYTANGFGLHDVLGNVWEWTADCWNEDYDDAPRVGGAREDGECEVRVMRGGSWRNDPAKLRAAYRTGSSVSFLNNNLGFRVVRAVR